MLFCFVLFLVVVLCGSLCVSLWHGLSKGRCCTFLCGPVVTHTQENQQGWTGLLQSLGYKLNAKSLFETRKFNCVEGQRFWRLPDTRNCARMVERAASKAGGFLRGFKEGCGFRIMFLMSKCDRDHAKNAPHSASYSWKMDFLCWEIVSQIPFSLKYH